MHEIAEIRSRNGLLTNPGPGEVNNEAVLFWGELTNLQTYVCEINIGEKRIDMVGVLYGTGSADGGVFYRLSNAVPSVPRAIESIEEHAKRHGYEGFAVDGSSLRQIHD